MCGLIGGNNPDWRYEAAVRSLRHRGPDGQQILNLGPMTFGFTRLAVVDTSHAADQPMLSPDGEVCLVFNGEVYGHRQLRTQLERRSHRFRTHSDTEVVLNAYLEWGAEFVDHIDGMFAIGIYDRRCNRLFLYRDRAGIKPLYYLWDGINFSFASELEALQTLCHDVSLAVDNTALYDFLTYGYVPAPKTLYRNVCKLLPATRLVFDVGKRSLQEPQRYWELPTEPRPLSNIEAASEELQELMQCSVDDQLVADVPVGCFLSGGIDSSIVVATASEQVDSLQTFSVGFDVAEHSESDYAKEVAERFHTEHLTATFRQTAVSEQLAELKRLYCEPFADTSAFPTHRVACLARERVTVALSGDGGDELFGGYKWYQRYARLMRLGATRLPGPSQWLDATQTKLTPGSLLSKVVGAAAMATTDPLSLYVRMLSGIPKSRKRAYAQLLEIEDDYDDCWYFRQYWRPDLPVLTRLQYLDFHTYLPDDILTKVDRASMADSLEVRVPFLSRELIEFAFSLPESVRYDGRSPKGILKRTYQQTLPASILSRSKQGFSIPPSHLSSYGGRFREIILEQNHGVQPDADRLPFELGHRLAQSEQHPGNADVQRLCQKSA